GTVPIRLYSASNAPPRHSAHAPPAAAPRVAPPPPPLQQQRRSVPGCPYIQFIDDDDYDGSYPFDAFQDLRSAYGASPLASLQHRMRSIQQQRAETQLQRQLLEQQLRVYDQRERELRRCQMALEQQRLMHVRGAADKARRAYLERPSSSSFSLEKKKEEEGFVQPALMFAKILESQIRSQDEVERRRAQKLALSGLLDEYFAPPPPSQSPQPAASATAAGDGGKPVTPKPVIEPTPSSSSLPPAAASVGGVQKAPLGLGSSLEPDVLDSVLRIVHRRLGEIAALDDNEEDEATAAAAAAAGPAGKQELPPKEATSPAGVPDQKGVEIEEPIDYSKLANILRGRVNTLNDVNTFIPRSPPLEQLGAATSDLPLSESKEDEEAAGKAGSAMQVDSEAAEHTDSEFAGLMSDCKAQLRELQETNTTAAAGGDRPQTGPGKRRHRRSRQRSRHRTRQHDETAAASTTEAAAMAPPLAESETSTAQKQAVNTIEDYILGVRNARKKEAAAAMDSLRQLHAIELELDAIRMQYNQQVQDTQLSFVADKSGGLRLAYNGDNKPFLMYQDVLQRLLARLDAIPSHGDEVVRAKRKTVVVKIQHTLDALDQFAADQESELSSSVNNEGSGELADDSSNCD
ncbi:hypothetical protein GGF38_001824, partial [Coemansia sp. RSA 25]